jgi:hypothetical protein
MRYLGADHHTPADDVERLVMVALHNSVIAEEKRLNG